MSNETGLDWLARNVHEWPVNTPHVVPYGDKSFEFGATFHQGYVDIYGRFAGGGHSIYRNQWLARRAELQNKPSWDDFGESAKFMAQDSDGAWMAFEIEPTAKSHVWSAMRGWCGYAREGSDRCCGEVIGDWRDTLERRPADLSGDGVSDDTAAIQRMLSADVRKSEPKIDTSAERVQKAAESMHVNARNNDWFERGELPPVGTVCLYVVSDRLSAEVEITAHAKLGLCFVQVGQSGESYVSKTAELHRFRPIRTERDVLIEIIKQWDGLVQTDDVLADAILAAGFSLRAK